MKQFLAKLFWRNNSRSGLLFGILLNTVIWIFVTLPVLLYALQGLNTDFLHYTGWSPYEKITISNSTAGLIAALYTSILCALYCADLMNKNLRPADSATRRFFRTLIAMLCVLSPVMAILLLVCAVRSGNRKAVVFACVYMLSFVLFTLLVSVDSFAYIVLIELTPVLHVAGLVCAVYALDRAFPRIGRWGYVSVFVIVLVVLIGETTNAILNRAVENCFAMLDEIEARYDSIANWKEQKQDFDFSQYPIPDLSEYTANGNTNIRNLFLTEDQIVLFGNVIASNSVKMARTDGMLLLGESSPEYTAFRQAAANEYLFSVVPRLSRYYGMSIRLAEHNRDYDGIMAGNRKMKHVRDLLKTDESAWSLLGFFHFNAVEECRISLLQQAVPFLSDSDLSELRNDIETYLDNMEPNLRQAVLTDTSALLFAMQKLKNNTGAGSKLHKLFGEEPNLPIFNMFRAGDIMFNSVQVSIFGLYKKYTAIMNQPGVGYKERFDNVDAEIIRPKTENRNFVFMLSTFAYRDILYSTSSFGRDFDIGQTAVAALAVEQYRRKHNGAFPESLDALVPEFLDTVPHSYMTGEPLVYEYGDVIVPASRDVTGEMYGYFVHGGQTKFVHGDEVKYGPILFAVPLESLGGKTPHVIVPDTHLPVEISGMDF